MVGKYESISSIQDMITHTQEYVDVGELSDGSHSFNELYYHRMILFAVICNTYKEYAWKSKSHNDGTVFDNYFIVGINTPDGQYFYHCHIMFWNVFNVNELIKAPEWDGHESVDIDRLLSLVRNN